MKAGKAIAFTYSSPLTPEGSIRVSGAGLCACPRQSFHGRSERGAVRARGDTPVGGQ